MSCLHPRIGSRRIAVAMLVLAIGASSLWAKIIYVKSDAAGTNTGATWANAYTLLQSALTGAVSGDQIWVAAGTYTPTIDHALGLGTRGRHFRLKNGVTLYGGFIGTETTVADRNWVTNVAELSGDIGVQGDDSDNAYHVFFHPTGVNLNGTAILDGFRISGGNADSDTQPHCFGGGMYNEGSSPTLTNCTFSANSALNDGAGMHNSAGSAPLLTNCTFSGNAAAVNGGGIYNGASSPSFTNCTFSGNSAVESGGGMLNYQGAAPTLMNCTFRSNSTTDFSGGGGMANWSSSPTLTNCVFSGNSTTSDVGGGGMVNHQASSPTLVNCSFGGNTGTLRGGGMANWQISNPVLKNCVFWGNTAPQTAQVFNERVDDGFPSTSTPTVQNCNIAGSGGSGAGWDEALGTDLGGNRDGNPLFLNVAGGDLHLSAGSACIDSALSAGAPATDKDGVSRFDDPGATNFGGTFVDIGAFEFGGWRLNVASTPASGLLINSTSGLGGVTDYEKYVSRSATVNLTAPPTMSVGGTEYVFIQWSGTPGGTTITNGGRTLSFSINANAALTANYDVYTWTLDVRSTSVPDVQITSTTGHEGSTNYQLTVDDNDTVTLTAPAAVSVGDTDYHFTQWSGAPAGTTVSDGGRTISFAINANTIVTAQYSIDRWALSVASTPMTGVGIASTTGNGGVTNYVQNNVNDNSSVSLIAPASKNVGGVDYRFVGWDGAPPDAVISPDGRTIDFTMNAPVSLTAQFELQTWTLTVVSTPEPSVSIASSTGHEGVTGYQLVVNDNTNVSLTAPETVNLGGPDYYFVQWSGLPAGAAISDGGLTIGFAINADATVTAEYTTQAWTLDVKSTPLTGAAIASATGHGGTTDYQKTLGEGATVRLTAPATMSDGPSDYQFAQWSGTPGGTQFFDGGRTIEFAIGSAVSVTAQYGLAGRVLNVATTPFTGVAITSTTGHGGSSNYQRTIDDNTPVALTAPQTLTSGAKDYDFIQWLGAPLGTVVSDSGRTISFTIGAAETVTAEYAVAGRTLNVLSSPKAGVVVTGIPLGMGGTTNYTRQAPDDSEVQLTAPLNPMIGRKRFLFDHWTVNGVAQPQGQDNITVKIEAETTDVEAVYEQGFSVTFPSEAGISLVRGNRYEITWSSASFALDAKLKIVLLDSENRAWVIAPSVSNTGSWRWTVGKWKSKTQAAYPNGEGYRIRVSSLDDTEWDEGDEDFAIGSILYLEITGPAGASSGQTVQYQCLAHLDFGDAQNVTTAVKWKLLWPKGAVKSAVIGKGVAGGSLTVLPAVPAVQECTVIAGLKKMSRTYPITISP